MTLDSFQRAKYATVLLDLFCSVDTENNAQSFTKNSGSVEEFTSTNFNSQNVIAITIW